MPTPVRWHWARQGWVFFSLKARSLPARVIFLRLSGIEVRVRDRPWGERHVDDLALRDSPWFLCLPSGSDRRRPSFSVPRLCRGVHRPAAAALRTLARGYGVGGWPGLGPAAAVARRILAVAGRGSARSGLARLRGRLHLQGLICLGWPLVPARCWAGRLHEQNRCSTADPAGFSALVLVK